MVRRGRGAGVGGKGVFRKGLGDGVEGGDGGVSHGVGGGEGGMFSHASVLPAVAAR